MSSDLTLISGSCHSELAESISKELDIPLTPVTIKNFADGETYVQVNETIRGSHAYVVQSFCKPINESLMELLILIDALKRASAEKITAVCPYLGYSRQDRKSDSREPITAKLVANLLTTAGVNRVVTFDLHASQIQGFYDIPLDHLSGYPLFAKYIKNNIDNNYVIVSPDVGGVKRANRLADLLGVPIAIIDKVRSKHNHSEVSHIVGSVKDHTAILFDDMVDTGGSITNAAKEVKEQGAKNVIICATHAILSENAIERLNNCPASKIIFLDTLKADFNKIKNSVVIPTAPLLSKVIKRIESNQSVGELLDNLVKN